jgi:hypothetical protein
MNNKLKRIQNGKLINTSLDLKESFNWACEGPHHLIPYKKSYKPHNKLDKNSKNLYGDHLRELIKYTSKCEHITEIGHNVGHTARAFISHKPKTFRAYDIVDFSNNGIKELCEANEIDYKFKTINSLDINIDEFEQTEFLWLDGNHSFEHVYKELIKFENKVQTYIFSDDIEAEGTPGPTGYGVLRAFNKFLNYNDKWELEVQNILGPGFIGIKRKK